MTRKIFLFGSGTLGYKALFLIGPKNVECFCDNNLMLVGTQRWGKNVISFDELVEQYSDDIIVICAAPNKAFSICQQLEEKGLNNFWIYKDVEANIKEYDEKEIKEYLTDLTRLLRYKCNFFMKKIEEVQRQVDYLKNHIDIRDIKPAYGDLRKKQLAEVQFANDVFEHIKDLQVSPFLYAGNLLGFVRHGGYIPWDDDFDLGLIRHEYEKLRTYCMTNMNGVKIEGKLGKLIIEVCDRFDCFTIAADWMDGIRLTLEFFSFDYYKDDYDFDEYKKCAREYKSKIMSMENQEEKICYIREMVSKHPYIVNKSNLIYAGFDNMDSCAAYDRGKMIQSDLIFPLQKVIFEEKEFWAPNKPEEFLAYIYKNIWDFPSDVGLHKHSSFAEPW